MTQVVTERLGYAFGSSQWNICTEGSLLKAGSRVYVLLAELLLGLLHIYAILGQQPLTPPLFVARTVDTYGC